MIRCGFEVRYWFRVSANFAESFSRRGGGVREKRSECERSCVSLVRLFTWRIRRGGSRKWKGERWTNRQKHGLLLWQARSPIVRRRTRFSKCFWRTSTRQTIPWEKALWVKKRQISRARRDAFLLPLAFFFLRLKMRTVTFNPQLNRVVFITKIEILLLNSAI